MTKSRLGYLLQNVGASIDSVDMPWIFYCMNINMDSYITLQEFAESIDLSDHELDLKLDIIRSKFSIISNNKFRENRILSQIFTLANMSKSGVLTVEELLRLFERLELYITDQDAVRILTMMDIDNTKIINQSNFINYLKKSYNMDNIRAERVRNAATVLRLHFIYIILINTCIMFINLFFLKFTNNIKQ